MTMGANEVIHKPRLIDEINDTNVQINLIKGEYEAISRRKQELGNTTVLNEGVVQVQYVDTDFKTIAIENYGSGEIGSNYHYSPKEIQGYRFLEVKGKPSGSYTKGNALVIFIYQEIEEVLPEVGTVQVLYFDLDNNNLGLSDILTGFVGTMHVIKKKMIKGYTFSHVEQELVDVFVPGTKTIRCFYKRDSKATVLSRGHVISEYLDQDGQELIKEDFLTGSLGMPYEVVKKEIPGYRYLATREKNEVGYFSDEPTFVTMIYAKANANDQYKEGVVLASFVNENGQEIAKPLIQSNAAGTSFVIQPKEIPGYKLKRIQGKSKGIFYETTKVVTFHYQQKATISKKLTAMPELASEKENLNQAKLAVDDDIAL